jgi:hypothetical protein
MCINTGYIMSVPVLVLHMYYMYTQVEGTTCKHTPTRYLYRSCIEILRRNPLSQNFGPK